jgi:L-cysteine/cystine lyase
MNRPDPQEQARVEQARAQLPALESSIYLNAGTAGPIPAESDDAMRRLQDFELRYGRAGADAYEDLVARIGECRAVVAAVLHASPPSVALTRSTTDGLNAAIWSIDWQPGDEAVTTTIEHVGLLAPLAALAARGVRVRQADVGDGGDDERTLGAIEPLLGRRTRLVAVSHVSWLTGAVLPVRRIGDLARAAEAWFVIDGAQSAGAIDVEPAALGADFYGIPAEKWLLGPEGMGALWASPRAITDARQPYAGWWTTDEATAHPAENAPDPRLLPWRDARRFDTTGFHRPSVAGFGRSVGWLAMHVGLPWLHERGPRLAAEVADGLAGIPGVTVLTPRANMATLVAFRVRGWPAQEALDALQRRAFAVLRTLPALDALRASVGWFNSESELERFLDTVAELAAHTPESFPRRPDLVIRGK